MGDLGFDALIPNKKKQASEAPSVVPPAGGAAGLNSAAAALPVDPRLADTGAAEAGARGFMNAATFNMADEIHGIDAAGGNEFGQSSTPVETIMGLYKYFTGDPEAVKRYTERVALERRLNELNAQRHPIASTVGEVGGAVATPGLSAAKGATMAVRAGRAALTGGIQGVLAGAGEGEDPADRARRAAIGGGVGTAAGGLLSPLADLAVKGFGHVGGKVADLWRGKFNPDEQAAREVGAAQRSAQTIDPNATNRLRPDELADTPSAAIIDTAGQPGRTLARTAANTSDEAKHALESKVMDRFGGQSERITGWLNKNYHYPNPQAQQEAIDVVERTTNKANYAKAFSEGDKPILTDEMRDLIDRSPAVRDAIKAAIPGVQNRAASFGQGARNPGIRFEAGLPVFDRGPPNLQFWDEVKRQLQKAAYNEKGSSDAPVLKNLAQKLTDELDLQVPAYKPARQGAAGFFGAENALEAGQKFLSGGMSIQDAAKGMAKMSDPEKKLFRDGFLGDLVETLGDQRFRRNVLDKINESPNATKALNFVLGPQKHKEFEALLRTETIMDRARGAVTGNSSTAQQLIASGAIGTGSGAVLGFGTGNDVTTSGVIGGALMTGAKLGRLKISNEVSQKVGELLASRDQAKVDRGLALLAKSDRMMSALRHFDTFLAKEGAQLGARAPDKQQNQ